MIAIKGFQFGHQVFPPIPAAAPHKGMHLGGGALVGKNCHCSQGDKDNQEKTKKQAQTHELNPFKI
jgi:hypothetical protein